LVGFFQTWIFLKSLEVRGSWIVDPTGTLPGEKLFHIADVEAARIDFFHILPSNRKCDRPAVLRAKRAVLKEIDEDLSATFRLRYRCEIEFRIFAN